MTKPDFNDITACLFDAYGTLFSWKSAALHCREELGEEAEVLADLWRAKQLQYTWLRSLMGRHADFWHVTGDALDYAMASLGLSDPLLRSRLMSLFLNLEAFPEVKDTLHALKERGVKTAILSNGSPEMLTSAVSGAHLTPYLDHVISVEEVGVFKPHPSTYQLACDRLGLAPGQVCFLSANGWDIAGAAAFGLRAVWVNREGRPREVLPAHPEAEIRSLAELPALLAR